MEMWSRRKFFLTSLASSIAAGTSKLFAGSPPTEAGGLSSAGTVAPGLPAPGTRPIIISSANGLHALDKGMEILKRGGDTLDAVIAAVTVVEDDPNDDSVGYGGLPNEEGEVELDACVMHGPTHRAGFCGCSPADQKCGAAGADGNGEDESRDDCWRRGAPLCGGRGI